MGESDRGKWKTAGLRQRFRSRRERRGARLAVDAVVVDVLFQFRIGRNAEVEPPFDGEGVNGELFFPEAEAEAELIAVLSAEDFVRDAALEDVPDKDLDLLGDGIGGAGKGVAGGEIAVSEDVALFAVGYGPSAEIAALSVGNETERGRLTAMKDFDVHDDAVDAGGRSLSGEI